MSTTIGAAAHGAGSNLANGAPPDLPTEKRNRETEDEFRARMEAKAARLRSFGAVTQRATRSVAEAITDPELEGARFEEPELVDEPRPAPVPKPSPRPLPAAPSPTAQRHARWVNAYVIDKRSTVDIAAEYGVTSTAVGLALKKAGVEMRSRGGLNRGETIRACAGSCGRMTRPTELSEEDAPGTVCRVRRGMCSPCAGGRSGPVRPKRDPVRLCAGTCGRMTRPGNVAADDAPGAVFRTKNDMCQSCNRAAERGGPGRNVGSAERAEIVAAYESGATAVEIGEKHDRMPKTIRGALRRAGVQLRDDRSTRSGGTNKKVDDPAAVEAVRRLYVDEGLTQAAVADRLGSTVKIVQGVMARNNIPARPDAAGQQHERTPREPAPRTPRLLDGQPHAIGQPHATAGDIVRAAVDPPQIVAPASEPPASPPPAPSPVEEYLEHQDRVLRGDLARARIIAGLSRSEVAERMGIAKRGVHDIEEGIADPHLSTLRRYYLAIGVVVEHTLLVPRTDREDAS